MKEIKEFFDFNDISYTRQIIIGDKRYCAYCGKELCEDYDIDGEDYENRDYFCYCDCEDAKKEIDLKWQIHKLGRELRDMRAKYKAETEIKLTKIE